MTPLPLVYTVRTRGALIARRKRCDLNLIEIHNRLAVSMGTLSVLNSIHFGCLSRQSYRNLKMNFLLLVPLAIICVCDADELGTLSPSDIFQFINALSHNGDLSETCKYDLSIVRSVLSKTEDGSQRLQQFHNAFRFGVAHFLETRDRDRWMYASTECVEAARESMFFAAEFPLLYCHGYNAYKKEGLAFGICVPASCDDDRLYLLNEWRKFVTSIDEFPVDFVECTRSRMIRQWYQRIDSLSVFFVLVALVVLVCIATVYDVRYSTLKTTSQVEQILLSYSAKKNMAMMMKTAKTSNLSIPCLDGLRVTSLFWVIIGHTLWYLPSFTANVDELKKDFANFDNLWVTNFLLAVDTFFVLSATLTSFHFFRSIINKGETPELLSVGYWLRFYRHRFLRLWPTSTFTLLILTYGIALFHHYGGWPPTDPYVQCTQHGWENVLFLSSVTHNRCFGWTWTTSADYIMFLFSPLFLFALKYSTCYGVFLSCIVMIISCLLNIMQIIRYNFPPTQMLFVQPPIFNQDYMQHEVFIYNPPQYRVGAYVIGLCLGYLLSGYREPSGAKLSWQIKCCGWICSLLLGSIAFFGLYPAVQGWNWPIYNVIYGSMHRILWSFSIAWIIYACYFGFGGIINDILSWSIFTPISALSHSAYLLHMVPIMGFYLNFPFPIIYTGTLQILILCAVQIPLSLILALILTFICEFPCINLERIFLPKASIPEKRINDMDRRSEYATVNGKLFNKTE